MKNVRSERQKFYEIRYTVVPTRSRTFPVDMLRYDSACPSTEVDSHRLERAVSPETTPAEPIMLRRFSRDAKQGPQIGRWESFGWKVIRIEWPDGSETLTP